LKLANWCDSSWPDIAPGDRPAWRKAENAQAKMIKCNSVCGLKRAVNRLLNIERREFQYQEADLWG